MESIPVPITVAPGAQVPVYATAGAAGADIFASHDFFLEPLERKLVPTGLRIAVPPGFEVQVRPRSGLALRQGLAMVNSPGTIDSDYRGEIGLILINLGDARIEIKSGERVAQLVLCPVIRAEFQIVNSLDETARGDGGFGSTGI